MVSKRDEIKVSTETEDIGSSCSSPNRNKMSRQTAQCERGKAELSKLPLH